MAQSLGLILLLMNVNNISPHKTRCGQLDQVFLLIDGIRNNIYRWRSVATEQVMSSATVVLQFLIFYLETLSHMKGCLLSAVSAAIQHNTTLHTHSYFLPFIGQGLGPVLPGLLHWRQARQLRGQVTCWHTVPHEGRYYGLLFGALTHGKPPWCWKDFMRIFAKLHPKQVVSIWSF